jgi:hypothetical protein
LGWWRRTREAKKGKRKQIRAADFDVPGVGDRVKKENARRDDASSVETQMCHIFRPCVRLFGRPVHYVSPRWNRVHMHFATRVRWHRPVKDALSLSVWKKQP